MIKSDQNKKRIFQELASLVTEQRNADTMDIDTKSTEEIIKLISEEDKKVAYAVEKEIPCIARAVELIVESFKKGGRLFYIGAGTSGRLGVLDAAECPPTFGTDSQMIQGIIAGGKEALIRAVERAEDHPEDGAKETEKRGVTNKDVVVGISACKRTPYVVGALKKARSIGARTIFLICSPRSRGDIDVDVAICPAVGPEVIMGSTRMKAGTAEKMVLNMLTTTAMIRLGKVYGNMMVDLQATNQKLVERSKRVIMMAAGVDYDAAEEALEKARGSVKIAIVMIKAKVDYPQALNLLERAGGFVRKAIEKKVGRKRNIKWNFQ
ncbi:MAG: N-acetylmuramic acid 6-phosphate etherase [Candidatus Aerophobetes bacterium]|nr:N-acetylmuramic acid 6-phosphate etherase [Candidatus Aerophobetes bacterium]